VCVAPLPRLLPAAPATPPQVNCFVVRKGAPGFNATKIDNKIALRCVQNADMTFERCFVPDSARLPGVCARACVRACVCAFVCARVCVSDRRHVRCAVGVGWSPPPLSSCLVCCAGVSHTRATALLCCTRAHCAPQAWPASRTRTRCWR
jgi:hypothetical protein